MLSKSILVDVDVAWKVCQYGITSLFSNTTRAKEWAPTMLSVSKFVLESLLKRSSGNESMRNVRQQMDLLNSNVVHVEPNPTEIAFAEELEERAARANLNFEIGESQLVSVLIHRDAGLLLTGDKRAIHALHVLSVGGIDRRITTLEQLCASMIISNGLSALRSAICAHPLVDRALTICFACQSSAVSFDVVNSGLESYVEDIRRSTGNLLHEDLDF